MKRFVLYKNGEVIAIFKSEYAARRRFLHLCQSSCFKDDYVSLVDADNGFNIIAYY